MMSDSLARHTAFGMPRPFIHVDMVFGATGTIYLNDGVRPWETIWKGSKKKSEARRALAAKLLDDAEKVEAPSEVKRQAVLAQFILGFIYGKALLLKGADDPIGARDVRFQRGDDIWIHFDALLEQAEFRRSDKMTRNDLSKCVRGAGARDRTITVGIHRKRFMVLDGSAVQKLRNLTDDNAHANTPI